MVNTRSRNGYYRRLYEEEPRRRVLAVCKTCDKQELKIKTTKSKNVPVLKEHQHRSYSKKLQGNIKMENDFPLEDHNSPKMSEDAKLFRINVSAPSSSSSPRSSQSAEEEFVISSSRRYPKRHNNPQRHSIESNSGKPEIRASEGIRRSTRHRKLIYDNFNTTFIMDTQQALRNFSVFLPEKVYQEDAEIKDDYLQAQDCGNNTEADSAKIKSRKRHHESSSLDNSSNEMFSSIKRPRPRRLSQRLLDLETRNSGRDQKNSDDTEERTDSTLDLTSEEDHGNNTRKTKYHLRKTKPVTERYQANGDPPRRSSRILGSFLHNTVRCHRLRKTRNRTLSSSTCTEDNECFKKAAKSSRRIPSKLVRGDYIASTHGNRMQTSSEVSNYDKDTFFSHVGGLKNHIETLKNLVLVPKRYSEVFSNFNVKPVKGILFHGPPGTGKTYLANVLCNECERNDSKVSFFFRKGADILRKYVGESEKHLRELFKAAFDNRPSVIFFDEIDGLAPSRSSKQEHVHTSVVSTLLACMDGVEKGNGVLVIGATNRIDAIDPALRRSGRFDRELYFSLPTAKERCEILRIHVQKWPTVPEPSVLKQVAQQTHGFCGADLTALCHDAVRKSVKRYFPQIHESNTKYHINPFALKVELKDFMTAKSEIVPASRRVSCAVVHRVPYPVGPLVSKSLESLYEMIRENFTYAISRADTDKAANFNRPVCHSRLLITADSDAQGQTTYIAPALLSLMEHIFCRKLDLSSLHEVSGSTLEEACIQAFREISRNTPSVLYLPRISQWWDLIPESVQSIFLSQMKNLPVNLPVFILATSDVSYKSLPYKIQSMFSKYRKEVFRVELPNEKQRRDFFSDLFLKNATSPPPEENDCVPPVLLPVAPSPEPRKLNERELQDLYNEEEITLSELRTYLRDVCSKLIRNRLFVIFDKPVDVETFQDYLFVVKKPMDLETMMTKIDLHEYQTSKQFLDDIDLICSNALLYNPDKNPTDKLIRHQACCLHDTAYTLVKNMMSKEFESKCEKIAEERKQRNFSPLMFAPKYCRINRATTSAKFSSGSHDGDMSEGFSRKNNVTDNRDSSVAFSAKMLQKRENRKRRRLSVWARGEVAGRKKRPAKQKVPSDSPVLGTRNINQCEQINNANCTIKISTAIPPQTPKGHYTEKMETSHQAPSSSHHFAAPHSSKSAQQNADSDMDWESLDARGDFKSDLSLMMEQFPTNCFTECSGDDGTVKINRNKLSCILDETVKATAKCTVDELLDVYSQLCRTISKYAKTVERASLIQDLQEELGRFKTFKTRGHQ